MDGMDTRADTVAGRRPRAAAAVGKVLGLLVLLFFVGRAVAELIVVDFSDPASYAQDWGGPSLAGVLAVHMAPGLLAAAILVVLLRRRARRAPGRR